MLTEYGVSVPIGNQRDCYRKDIEILDRVNCFVETNKGIFQYVGVNNWKAGLLVSKAVFVHILPCVLLIIFTAGLFKTVDRADRKRSVHQMPCRKTVGSFLIASQKEVATSFKNVISTLFLIVFNDLLAVILTSRYFDGVMPPSSVHGNT